MKAVVFHDIGDIRLDNVSEPELHYAPAASRTGGRIRALCKTHDVDQRVAFVGVSVHQGRGANSVTVIISLGLPAFDGLIVLRAPFTTRSDHIGKCMACDLPPCERPWVGQHT
jgi:hypothetical protein